MNIVERLNEALAEETCGAVHDCEHKRFCTEACRH